MSMGGGCLCGQVRYDVRAEPLMTAACHCRHCQRQSGSAFSVVCVVPSDAFTLHGQTRIFADVGDSGQSVERHFCPDCGSPILSLAAALPGMTIIKAGTLDSFPRHVPTAEAYCDHRLPWLPPFPGTQTFLRSNI